MSEPVGSGARTAAGHDRAERIDRRQLVALLRLLLGQMLRRGRDASTGTRGFPLLQVVLATTLMGIMTLPYAWRAKDLASYVTLVFLVGFVMVALNILPETHEARQRNVDVLHVRPVPARTSGIARGFLLAAMATLLTGAFGLVALSAGLWRFGASPTRVGALWLALVLSAFAVSGAWSTTLLVVLRWVRIEVVRRASQTLLLFFVLAFSLASTGLITFGLGATWRLDLAAAPVLAWLPSTWFAQLALPGHSWGQLAQRAAAVTLLVAVVATSLSRRLHRQYQAAVERLWSRGTRSVAEPLAVRLLGRVARVPLLGPRLLPPAAQGVAAAILLSAAREEIARLRTFAVQALAVVFFIYGLAASGDGLALHMLGYSLFAVTLDSLASVRQSASAGGCWVFFKAPIEARHVLRGIEAAVLCRWAAPSLLLLASLALVRLPLALAALVTLGAVAVTVNLLALDLVLHPTWPLSQDLKAAQSPLGLVLGLFVSLVASGMAWAVIAATELSPWLGIPLGLGVLTVLAVAGWALRLWAASRLDRVRLPG